MKRLGRVLGSMLAVALAVISLQAVAETQVGGRDFNHLTTGFPLTGVHGTVACETCHIGGVFKGTPRACDGCHAMGKRIVATPKTTSHIVTDAMCDTCHFNTSTFLGARFNHGSAIPGQCQTCHNGRNAAGKPASHNTGKKLTASCDSCHRSLAFLPASWNHVGTTPGSCEDAGCHIVGSGNSYTRNSPMPHTRTGMATLKCDRCHTVISWRPPIYDHAGVTVGASTCINCHNGGYAVTTPAGHVAIGTNDCDQCHTNTITWLGALGAMPSNHIPQSAWIAGAKCSNCHLGTVVATGNALHAYISVAAGCKTCHNTSPVYLGSMTRKTMGSHEGSKTTEDCISCHALQYTRWNKP